MQLSKTERRVLHLLAWGKTNPEILEIINKERLKTPEKVKGKVAKPKPPKRPMSQFTLHNLCHSIRKKTGIKSTKDAAECRAWEKANPHFSPLQKEHGPTPKQMEILLRIAAGERYSQICREMVLSLQAAMNLASEARKRAKISDNFPSSVKAYLMGLKATPEPPKDPMDDPCF